MELKEKLLHIQTELKAPKGQYNNFGKYKYRSCEDILEAVKPLLDKYKAVLTIRDEVIQVGDRYYIKATADIENADKEEFCRCVSVSAFAREAESKAGMDASQITGTASSYARKYALNGLFLIDDTKDADTDEHAKQTEEKKITEKQLDFIRQIAKEQGKTLDEEAVKKWSAKQASDFIARHKGGKQ